MSDTAHSGCHCHSAGRGGVAAWLEILTLLGVATFLAFSYFANRLGAFLAPAYVWLTPAAAVVLYAMLWARIMARLRHRESSHGAEGRLQGADCSGQEEELHAHDEGHHGWRVPVWCCAAVLSAPILLALWVNPQQLSAEGARKRRLATPPRNVALERAFAWVLGLAAPEAAADARSVTLPKNPTVLDLLNAVDEGRGDQIEGQFVTMLGQCDLRGGQVPSGDRSGERFDLYRLVINCCIADATSVSVEVVPSAGAKLDPGGWVRVSGIIRFDSPLDSALPVVHAATISRIPEPGKPYL